MYKISAYIAGYVLNNFFSGRNVLGTKNLGDILSDRESIAVAMQELKLNIFILCSISITEPGVAYSAAGAICRERIFFVIKPSIRCGQLQFLSIFSKDLRI